MENTTKKISGTEIHEEQTLDSLSDKEFSYLTYHASNPVQRPKISKKVHIENEVK